MDEGIGGMEEIYDYAHFGYMSVRLARPKPCGSGLKGSKCSSNGGIFYWEFFRRFLEFFIFICAKRLTNEGWSNLRTIDVYCSADRQWIGFNLVEDIMNHCSAMGPVIIGILIVPVP